ncbi:hypothetical protein T4C_465 [Trichinella pseudospiralis]|uniref:Uncharacterized protein n=1 Tax=Trichinella pseudospiralis TaxID=6337 RepID=A0A0V1J3Z7_TRIPS|nr:hypothetical protein T4C_465 [Trichinella pseudospiralis]
MQCGAYCCAAHHTDCTVFGILLQDDLFNHQIHQRVCPALRGRNRMVVLRPDTPLTDSADHLRSSWVCSRWYIGRDLLIDYSSHGAGFTWNGAWFSWHLLFFRLFFQHSLPLRWCHVLPNPFTKLKLTIVACYTYIADLFAQGLDLSGRTRILHNVLVGVPAAMHSDGSFRHANVIAKIAPNSMQIFALSQLPGDIGVLSARIPYYICDTDIATERCGNRELEQNVEITPSGLTAVYGFSHPRGQTTAWAIGKVARTVTCSSVLCRTSRSGNSSVLSNGDTISRFVPEPPDDVDGVTSSGVDGSLVLAPRLETGGVRGLVGVDRRVAGVVLGDGRFKSHSSSTRISRHSSTRFGSAFFMATLFNRHTHFLLLPARNHPRLQVRCACTRNSIR